jgi:hypothetical protein
MKEIGTATNKAMSIPNASPSKIDFLQNFTRFVYLT